VGLLLCDRWYSHAVDAALDSEVLKAFSLAATNRCSLTMQRVIR
jgi:hypothetical protein